MRSRLLAIAVVLLASACSGASARGKTAADDGHGRATIVFLGDSNISFALTPVAFALTESDPSFAIVDVARASTGIRAPTNYWKVRVQEVLARTEPDGFVVNLGINDTHLPGSVDTKGYAEYGTKVDWLMQLLPKKVPVWWTNLPCDLEPQNRVVGCGAVNAALAQAPSRWPNLTVLDFAAVARGHHDYLLKDTGAVHLAGPGATAWADLVSKALVERFPA